MKILLVTPLYPPYARGGGGTVFSAIAKGLANRGHKGPFDEVYGIKVSSAKRIYATNYCIHGFHKNNRL